MTKSKAKTAAPATATQVPPVPKASTASEGTAAAPERKPAEQLNPDRIREADFMRTIHVATAHANTVPEDLLERSYWSHVSAKLKPWDHVEVRANDGTWYAEVLVLESGRNWAKVHMLRKYSLTTHDVATSQAAALSPYEIIYRGPADQWSVIRKADKQVLHDGEGTQGGAVDWLDNYVKAGA